MKHWYITGPNQISIIEEPFPMPSAGEVLIRIHYTALSPGSNVHVYRTGAYSATWSPDNVEMLYMGSGVIEAVGHGVDKARIGERVAFNGIGHQEYGVVKSDKAYRVPDGLSLPVASLAYLCAWSVSALHLGSYAAAETVAVVGMGLVGASAAITADAMGARVLALDVVPERLALAHHLGLGCVENPTSMDARNQAPLFLGESGADLIIETSGSWTGLQTAMDLARNYSRIALMGIYRDPPCADLAERLHHQFFGFPSKMHYQRVQIIGCGSDPESVSEPMPRMATRAKNFQWVLEQGARGRLNLGALVTSIVPAEDIEIVLERLADGDRSQIGVVFAWGDRSVAEAAV